MHDRVPVTVSKRVPTTIAVLGWLLLWVTLTGCSMQAELPDQPLNQQAKTEFYAGRLKIDDTITDAELLLVRDALSKTPRVHLRYRLKAMPSASAIRQVSLEAIRSSHPVLEIELNGQRLRFNRTKAQLVQLDPPHADQQVTTTLAQMPISHWLVGTLDHKKWIMSSRSAGHNDPSTKPFLQFTLAGTVQGSDGCNLFRGHYRQQNQQLNFHQLVSTKRACLDPHPPRTIMAALGNVRYFNAADSMTLYDANQQPVLYLKAALNKQG